MNRSVILLSALSLFVAMAACGGGDDETSATTDTTGAGGEAGSGAAGSGTSGSATAGSGTAGSGTAGAATAGSGTSGSATAGSGTAGSATAGSGTAGSGTAGSSSGGKDPTKPGPFQVKELSGNFKVAATGNTVAMHAYYPATGDGPFPVVVFAHGFQLPANQYNLYIQQLASYGYVALTADFQAGLFGTNHVKNAQDVLGGIDWAFAENDKAGGPLSGKVDKDHVGLSGHSLGGKLSILGASLDKRVKASITFDPVDSSVMCNPTDCPDTSMKLPLPIPTAFLGETLDGAGGFMPCAPMADNYTTFYAAASSPSLEVTVNGANHMSFVDNPATCGFQCGLCKQATADQKQVISLSHAYFVSFYERIFRNDAAYDGWLSGAEAKAAFGNLVTVQSK